MSHTTSWMTGLAAASVLALSGAAQAAGPEEVQGPGAMPECFAPFSDSTKYFQFEKKEPPTGSRWPTASSATPGASR